MKYLIFDAGPIISLSMNGLLYVLEGLKEACECEFIITPQVYKEIVEKPMKIKKFKLEAIKVKNLIEKKILTMSHTVVKDSLLVKETNTILKEANGVLRSEKTNEKITILHEGEASCLAFAHLCNCENLLVVDERTTRLLFESSENVKNLIEKKTHSTLSANFDLIKQYSNFRFIRSAELVYFAYKRNMVKLGKGKDVLDALLYSLKFNGTTISSNEIEYLKKLQ